MLATSFLDERFTKVCLMTWIYLLAQAAAPVITNPVDPMAPWISLILQGGGFALAVVIVTILYPRAAKDAREERDKRDQMWLSLVNAIQEKFENRNKVISDAIEKQTDTMTTEFKASANRIEQAVVNVCRGRFGGTRETDKS